jgi:hypothetical protein
MSQASAQHASNHLGISGKSINRPATKRNFEKYRLQRRAASILHNHSLSAAQQHRTCWCHRGVANPSENVGIYRQKSGESARMHGVTTCKSVWACPVCSARICAVRQAELSDAMQAWIGQGGYTWLMTLTFPHEFEDKLSEILPKFTKAKAYFKNCKTYKRILASMDKGGTRKGSVTSLEVTFGENGAHPHQHDLIFAAPDTFGQVKENGGKMESSAILELKKAWCIALAKAGLCQRAQMSDVMAHGLDIRGGQYAAEYIAKFGKDQKWGLSREVTMHAAKVGSDSKGAHPFQLLAWAENGDGQAAEQFREYVEAFEGKRMLSWSRGLKKALTGTEETSDEEAAERELPEEEQVGRIDAAGLAVIQSRKLLAHFLEFVAEHCGDPATAQNNIDEYLKICRDDVPRTAQGIVKVKMFNSGFMHVDREKVEA